MAISTSSAGDYSLFMFSWPLFISRNTRKSGMHMLCIYICGMGDVAQLRVFMLRNSLYHVYCREFFCEKESCIFPLGWSAMAMPGRGKHVNSIAKTIIYV